MMQVHSPALRRLLLAVAVVIAAGSVQADGRGAEPILLAEHAETGHADDAGHRGQGQHGGGQGQRKRLGKGPGTGEARGGHSAETDIFRDEGFGKGPPEGRGEHEDGDDHDHEDGEEGGGPPEGRGDHTDGEAHDHEA